MSQFMQAFGLTIVVAILTVLALTAAVVLQVLGDDASHAWEAFGGFAVFFAGVHVPSPLTS